MDKNFKKVTANLPKDRLEEAMRITGRGVTETLVVGLDEIRKKAFRTNLLRTQGKVRFELDLAKTRR